MVLIESLYFFALWFFCRFLKIETFYINYKKIYNILYFVYKTKRPVVSQAYQHMSINVKATRWLRFPLDDISKFHSFALASRQRAALSSATQRALSPEFRGKTVTNTRFPSFLCPAMCYPDIA